MVFNTMAPESMKGALTSLLSPSDREIAGQLPQSPPLNKEHLHFDLIEHIHYSWLTPFLRTLAQSEIRCFLATLSSSMQQGLEKALGFENNLPELTKIAKRALRQILLDTITQGKDLVPFAFVPEHPLNFLLDIPHQTLERLVRFLGLHDLSFEMRQIISTKEMKKIFSSLTSKEGEYLNALILHREPLIFERLFLNRWDGSKEGMAKLLKEKGATRLGHLLWSTSDSFQWYLTHKLEMHTAMLVLKHIEKPSHGRGGEILQNQVSKIISFLTKGEEQ